MFRAIENKNSRKFVKFDIAEFYSLISTELLEKSINFARSISKIEDKVINKIKHLRKSLLFHNGKAWLKKKEILYLTKNNRELLAGCCTMFLFAVFLRYVCWSVTPIDFMSN